MDEEDLLKRFIEFSVGDEVYLRNSGDFKNLLEYYGRGPFVVILEKRAILETRQCDCGGGDGNHVLNKCQRIQPPILISDEEYLRRLRHLQRIKVKRLEDGRYFGSLSGIYFRKAEEQ